MIGLLVVSWALGGDGSYALVDVRSPVLVVRADDSVEGVTPPILDFRCSAVRLDSSTVLTAAHCVDGPMAVASGGEDICGPRSWSRADVTAAERYGLDTSSLAVTADRPEPLLVRRVAADSLVAIGWQQPDRTRPLSCAPVLVELGRCRTADQGFTCRSGAVCSGLSGAGVYDRRGLVGVISASDGCSDGSTVLVSAIPPPVPLH